MHDLHRGPGRPHLRRAADEGGDPENVVRLGHLSILVAVRLPRNRELRHLTGRDEPVAEYVFRQDGAAEFVDGYAALLAPALPAYIEELKPNVTIAVGCTGGKHRSVASAERISARLRANGFKVSTQHRDLGRE